jgi:hypothetical protein
VLIEVIVEVAVYPKLIALFSARPKVGILVTSSLIFPEKIAKVTSQNGAVGLA